MAGSGLTGATVEVGGVPADVLTSSNTEISFVVPTTQCLPARESSVEVRSLQQSVSVPATVIPQLVLGTPLLGEGWIDRGTDPEGHCLHLSATDEEVGYLIGVQSLSEDVGPLASVGFKMSTGVPLPSAVGPLTREESAVTSGLHALSSATPSMASRAPPPRPPLGPPAGYRNGTPHGRRVRRCTWSRGRRTDKRSNSS